MTLCATKCGATTPASLVMYGDLVLLGNCPPLSPVIVTNVWLANMPQAINSVSTSFSPACLQTQQLSNGIPAAFKIINVQNPNQVGTPVLYNDSIQLQLNNSIDSIYNGWYLCFSPQGVYDFIFQPLTVSGPPSYQFSLVPGFDNTKTTGEPIQYSDIVQVKALGPPPPNSDHSAFCTYAQTHGSSCGPSCNLSYSCPEGIFVSQSGPPITISPSQGYFIPWASMGGVFTISKAEPSSTTGLYNPNIPCSQNTNPCTTSVCMPPVCTSPGICSWNANPVCTPVYTGPNTSAIPQWSCKTAPGSISKTEIIFLVIIGAVIVAALMGGFGYHAYKTGKKNREQEKLLYQQLFSP